jgi:regulator of sigma D
MTNQPFSGVDRRQKTNKLVQELLQERQQVWSLYCSIAGLDPDGAGKPIDALVQEFCQVLVDYISLGHFGIYQRIIDENERRLKVVKLAEQIYPHIAEATEVAVDFNDKYETLGPDEIRKHLTEDLSRLGEELAKRIELEDQLIKAMSA